MPSMSGSAPSRSVRSEIAFLTSFAKGEGEFLHRGSFLRLILREALNECDQRVKISLSSKLLEVQVKWNVLFNPDPLDLLAPCPDLHTVNA